MAKVDYPHLELLQLYEALISEFPEIQLKGKKNPYTSVNGHMFSFIDKDAKLSMRFSDQDRLELIEQYDAQPSIQYGATMRGYVIIPDKLMGDKSILVELLQKSYDYVSSLKPKPTRK